MRQSFAVAAFLLASSPVLAQRAIAPDEVPGVPDAPIASDSKDGGAKEGKQKKDKAPAPPEFTLKNLGGAAVSLSGLKGKVVLLDFFATWCGPCGRIVPMLNDLHIKYGAQGFVILAINQAEDPAKVKKYVADKGIPYEVLMDVEQEVAASYGVDALPSLFLIDKKGSFVIPKDGSTIDDIIQAELAKK